MTLTDFLLARIAEDEDTIRFSRDCGEPTPIAHEQMLAECEAKRRIVDYIDREGDTDYRRAFAVVTRELALPYADHPDYREEWKP